MKEIETTTSRLKYMTDWVKEFRRVFKINNENQSQELTAKMLREEVEEYHSAKTDTEKLDALTDILYLTIGGYIREGYNDEDIFSAFLEVHMSNLSKLEDGEIVRKPNGKIGKGKYFREPDFSSIIKP